MRSGVSEVYPGLLTHDVSRQNSRNQRQCHDHSVALVHHRCRQHTEREEDAANRRFRHRKPPHAELLHRRDQKRKRYAHFSLPVCLVLFLRQLAKTEFVAVQLAL